MASLHSLLLCSSLLLTALSTVTARPGLPFHPCKTLLVSTYSVSFGFKPNTDNNNPDATLPNHPHHGRPDFFAVVAEVRELDPKPLRFFLHRPRFFSDRPEFNPNPQPHLHHLHHHRFPQPESLNRDQTLVSRPDVVDLPFFGSSTSFRERAIDVLNVLASLLFGAACGALTAGTMYLIWSLFTCRFDGYHRGLDGFSDDDDNDDDEEDIFNPKKPHNTYTNTNDEVKGAPAVPAPASLTDSADTALLKKETV